ncbi:unnamed protein product, partial [Amoebophrya sp. A25]
KELEEREGNILEANKEAAETENRAASENVRKLGEDVTQGKRNIKEKEAKFEASKVKQDSANEENLRKATGAHSRKLKKLRDELENAQALLSDARKASEDAIRQCE